MHAIAHRVGAQQVTIAHNRLQVPAGHAQGLEALVRCMMRSPISLSRLRFAPGSPEVAAASAVTGVITDPRKGA